MAPVFVGIVVSMLSTFAIQAEAGGDGFSSSHCVGCQQGAQTSLVSYSANPAVQGETACVGEQDIACFDMLSAKRTWTAKPSGGLESVVIAGQLVIAGTSTGVHAYSRLNGILRWQVSTQAKAFTPTVFDGVAYTTTVDGWLIAIELSSGARLWQRQFDGWIYPPAVVQDRLFIGGQHPSLSGIDRHTGETLWRREIPGELVFRPVPGVLGDAIITTFSGHVMSVGASDGLIRWQVRESVANFSPTLFGARIYQLAFDQKLRVRSARTGELIWRSESTFKGHAVTVNRGWVLGVGADDQLVALNANNGARKSVPDTVSKDANAVSRPLIDAYSLITFGSAPGVDSSNRRASDMVLKRHALFRPPHGGEKCQSEHAGRKHG